ncbi:hypothetical protein SSTU70S_01267 [Stutzerimonas stutzeri]
MTLLSYPMIAIPSMVMMMAIFFYLWRTIHGLTGLRLEDIIATPHERHPEKLRLTARRRQNTSLNRPITTIRPMMKMIPAVPPMNFNMPYLRLSGVCNFVTPMRLARSQHSAR